MKIHKYVKNMETGYPLAPSIKNGLVRWCFTNFTATRAKCKRCKKTFQHTFLEDFTKHLQKTPHQYYDYERIIELENRILQKGPMWKYIKLRRDSSESYERYECVLCRGEIANLDEEFLRHTHAHDEDNYTLKGKSYEEWQLKYCKRRKNNSIQCQICKKKVHISYRAEDLLYHLKKCDEITQKQHE